MAGTITTSAGNTTAKFEYTTNTAKMTNILTAAAHYLWDVGYGDHGTLEAPILFASLTNQQKLDIIDAHLRQVIMDAAKTYAATSAANTARDTAIADAEINLKL